MTLFYQSNPTWRLFTLAIAAAAVLGLPSKGDAQVREWSASGGKENIVLGDCRDCGDDVGMLVHCRGQTQPAVVTVAWAASETGREQGSVPVSIEVDGQVFQRNGTTVYFGQLGHVPTFELQPNDPLIPALQSGRIANISTNVARTSIGLRGSRDAFEIFKAHCGWNRLPVNDQGGVNQPQGNQPTFTQPQGNQPTFTQPQGNQPTFTQPQGNQPTFTQPQGNQPTFNQPQGNQPSFSQPQAQPSGVPGTSGSETANADGTQWFTIEHDTATTGKSGTSLIFGIPETDAIAINATCEAGNPGPYIPVMALIDLAGMPNGVPAQAQIQGGAFQKSYQGTVSVLSDEYAGLQLAIPVEDPFWSALSSGQPLSIRAPGGEPATLSAPGSVGAVFRFLEQCRSLFRG